MINQGGPEIRHIYMDVPHSKHVKPSWYENSVGHFEGGQLGDRYDRAERQNLRGITARRTRPNCM